MLSDIRREVREIVRTELQVTLQYYSDKIDEYEEKISRYESNLKTVENQCKDMKNTYLNLKLKNDVLEQKINAMEQRQMSNLIEICGVSESENENLQDITSKICAKLQLSSADASKAYRKKKMRPNVAVQGPPSPIVVSLREGCRDQWLSSSRNTSITGRDLGREDSTRIYIRESLTPTTAFLLWKSKKDLKETGLCKFVWLKNGVVLAKKTENDKAHVIRSESDMERMKEVFS
ncbi:hypothetical protein JYU34_022238 [Plutella xylostella]|uniref:Zinc finger DNA binding protein n=3 Tax=Plutella xylostella TaxID=51655 RepID=A0ABQ7PQH6_PLUXY|nr:hypothetical protein JYU34_022238 [Plutella xylostella]